MIIYKSDLYMFEIVLRKSFSTCRKNVRTTYQRYYVTVQTTTKRLSYTRTCTQTCSTHVMWCWSYSTVCKYVLNLISPAHPTCNQTRKCAAEASLY